MLLNGVISVQRKYIITAIAAVVAVSALVPVSVFAYRNINYSAGISHFDNEEYIKSVECFNRVQNYKDSHARLAIAQQYAELESKYEQAELYLDMGNYATAEQLFTEAIGYRDANDRATDVHNAGIYQTALDQYNNGQYQKALDLLSSIPGYKDAGTKATKIRDEWNEQRYNKAVEALANKQYTDAQKLFRDLGNYKDSAEQYNTLLTYDNLYSKFRDAIKKSFASAKEYFDLLPSDYIDNDSPQYVYFVDYIDYCGEYVYQNGNMTLLDIDFYIDGTKLYAADYVCSLLWYNDDLWDMRNDTTNLPPNAVTNILAGSVGTVFDWWSPLVVDDTKNGVIHNGLATITFTNGQVIIDDTWNNEDTVQIYNKKGNNR